MSEKCEYCGTDIYCGPPDCPKCGAPNCCPKCCREEELVVMTAPANNDRPSEMPKPPEDSWLDFLISQAAVSDYFNPSHIQKQSQTRTDDVSIRFATCDKSAVIRHARAELSALRTKAAAYDEAMKRVWARHHELIVENPNGSEAKSLRKYLRGEIEAGRFKP